jgi:hypothetical protein
MSRFSTIFSFNLNAYNSGRAVGYLLFWLTIFGLIGTFLYFGRRLVKSKREVQN